MLTMLSEEEDAHVMSLEVSTRRDWPFVSDVALLGGRQASQAAGK